MQHDDYFTTLEYEFKGLEYQKRFLQELKDHAQDLQKDENIDAKDLSQSLNQRFGSPKQVKTNFTTIMKPFRWLFFILEGLVFGLLTSPLMSFLALFSIGVGDLLKPTHFYFAIVRLLILSVIYYLFSYFVSRRYFRHHNFPRSNYYLWLGLVFGLGILIFFALLYNLFSITGGDIPSFSTQNAVISFIFFVVFQLIFIRLTYKPARRGKLFSIKKPNMAKLKLVTRSFLLVYFLAFVLFRTLSSYPFFEFMDVRGAWMIFFPFIIIEMFMGVGWGAVARLVSFGNTNYILFVYLPAAILAFVCLRSFFLAMKNKNGFL